MKSGWHVRHYAGHSKVVFLHAAPAGMFWQEGRYNYFVGVVTGELFVLLTEERTVGGG